MTIALRWHHALCRLTGLHHQDSQEGRWEGFRTDCTQKVSNLATDHSDLNVQFSNNYLQQEPLNSHMNVTQKKVPSKSEAASWRSEDAQRLKHMLCQRSEAIPEAITWSTGEVEDGNHVKSSTFGFVCQDGWRMQAAADYVMLNGTSGSTDRMSMASTTYRNTRCWYWEDTEVPIRINRGRGLPQ